MKAHHFLLGAVGVITFGVLAVQPGAWDPPAPSPLPSMTSTRSTPPSNLATVATLPAVSPEQQAALNRSMELLPQVSQAMSDVQTHANRGDVASACASLQPAAAGYTELTELFPQIPADKRQAARAPMVTLGESIKEALLICEGVGF